MVTKIYSISMIKIKNISTEEPFKIFEEKYNQALKLDQKNIESTVISSFNPQIEEVDSRFVNLKFVINDEFIFFTNYNSPKADAFRIHNQMTALFFWPSINTQIRMKAIIKKTSIEFNQNYFFNRAEEKNALAISSKQSKPIDSYSQVKENYKKSLKNDDLKECPKYWGGYSFTPYEIEFWEGNKFRLNIRNLYRIDNTTWNHFILEP